MPTKTITTIQEIEDLACGATILGVGGGGSRESGIAALKRQLDKGNTIRWVDPSEIPDDAWTATTFGMGSIAPKGEDLYREMERFGLKKPDPSTSAMVALSASMEALERYTGKHIDVLVPVELGGGNACVSLAIGAEFGRTVVDGDYAGRAVPSGYQTGPGILGKNTCPMSTADSFGNVCFIERVVNSRMSERIGKYLSMASFVGCGMTTTMLSAAEMKEALYHNTLTECLELGRVVRKERERGKDPVEGIARFLGGWILTRGVVTKREWEDKEGYLWGSHWFEGKGRYAGPPVRVFFQNENHICWRGEKMIASSPDLIIVVDDKTGMPVTNTDVAEGMELAVIGAKGRDLARTPAGIAAFKPANFGFQIPYVPIEQLQSQ